MKIRLFSVLFSTVFIASGYAQDVCNPYENACAIRLAQRPQVGTLGPSGPVQTYPGSPLIEGKTPFVVWHLSELFIDSNDHAYGWLILENLDTLDQYVTVVYTFDNGNRVQNPRAPEYRYYLVPASDPRKAVTLNDPALTGEFYSATVYFPGKGSTHASFRPFIDIPKGTQTVEPQAIPQTK
jgi:hypothetical protein